MVARAVDDAQLSGALCAGTMKKFIPAEVCSCLYTDFFDNK